MDGTTHINVYSKGKTELGRKLSNFHECHIESSFTGGTFKSVEGLWYYMGFTHAVEEREVQMLRELSGIKAKQWGQRLRKLYGQTKNPHFKPAILEATEYKLVTDSNLLKRYLDNNLPLTHYYIMGEGMVFPDTNIFQMDFLNKDLRLSFGVEPTDG